MIWRHIFEIFDAISPHAIHGWNEKEVWEVQVHYPHNALLTAWSVLIVSLT